MGAGTSYVVTLNWNSYLLREYRISCRDMKFINVDKFMWVSYRSHCCTLFSKFEIQTSNFSLRLQFNISFSVGLSDLMWNSFSNFSKTFIKSITEGCWVMLTLFFCKTGIWKQIWMKICLTLIRNIKMIKIIFYACFYV